MRRGVRALLAVSTMSLATTSPTGEPHVAPVFFAASEQMDLYFFSSVNSQHSQDLRVDGRASAAIFIESHDWRKIRGLQLRGTASQITDPEKHDTALNIYSAKFPFISKLQSVLAQNELYVFVPHWVRLIDNRLNFGFKKEWTIP